MEFEIVSVIEKWTAKGKVWKVVAKNSILMHSLSLTFNSLEDVKDYVPGKDITVDFSTKQTILPVAHAKSK